MYNANEAAKELAYLKKRFRHFLRNKETNNEKEEREIFMELTALTACIQSSKKTHRNYSERLNKITERVNSITK